MKASQRFIAGAVCPQCQQSDSLCLDSLDQGIHCVDCDFVQSAAERAAAEKKQSDTKHPSTLENDAGKNKLPANKVRPSEIIPITHIKL